MNTYEVVFDAVIEEFNNDMFGPYANSVDSKSFIRCLGQYGWKYFDKATLNEMFAVHYRNKLETGEIEDLADIDEHDTYEEDDNSFFKT